MKQENRHLPDRQLILLRHAQAESSNGVSDRERQLTTTGKRQAEAAARWLQEAMSSPVTVVVSPAERCQQTAKIATQSLGSLTWETREEVYEADTESLCNLLVDYRHSEGDVLLCGHNPGMETLAALLSGSMQAMGCADGLGFIWLSGQPMERGCAPVQKRFSPPHQG